MKPHRLAELVQQRIKFELIKRKSPADIVRVTQKLAAANRIKQAWELLDQGIILYPRNAELIAVMRVIPNHYDAGFYENQQAGSLNRLVIAPGAGGHLPLPLRC